MGAFARVDIDLSDVVDWDTFHDVFARTLGFPSFYGRTMDAWIDCMTSLDEADDGMTTVHAPPGGVLVLQLSNAREFRGRCPEQYAALIEGSAFVNWRRIERGDSPVLCLSFSE